MTKAVVSKRKIQDIEIHPYGMKIDSAYRLIEKDLSKENVSLIKKYDRHMIQLHWPRQHG